MAYKEIIYGNILSILDHLLGALMEDKSAPYGLCVYAIYLEDSDFELWEEYAIKHLNNEDEGWRFDEGGYVFPSDDKQSRIDWLNERIEIETLNRYE